MSVHWLLFHCQFSYEPRSYFHHVVTLSLPKTLSLWQHTAACMDFFFLTHLILSLPSTVWPSLLSIWTAPTYFLSCTFSTSFSLLIKKTESQNRWKSFFNGNILSVVISFIYIYVYQNIYKKINCTLNKHQQQSTKKTSFAGPYKDISETDYLIIRSFTLIVQFRFSILCYINGRKIIQSA